MTPPVIRIAGLLCLAACAAAQDTHDTPTPPIACNLKAIDSAQRPRYNQLINRLRAAIVERMEIPQGYAFKIDGQVLPLPELAEWIGMERLCCPFLSFQLSVSSHQPGWSLELIGPIEAKPLIASEFPARQSPVK